jgi:hypothetical protein
MEIMRWIKKKTDEGLEQVEIKNRLKHIDKAFEIKEPAKKAKAINDIFRDGK